MRSPRKLSAEEQAALNPPVLCPAYCETHQRSCAITGVSTHKTAHGQALHLCTYGQWGHDFYWPGVGLNA